ncbi:hypothetical protein [Streptomyces reniochalinae]|uniref:DUF2304 family protein n=1 Tax=Streptomyces reniochalinae TaxID=2250578 RepID=A0A367EFQ6_9ACTN|nr:hypothetical protein [Streptomyces reniochalinae]RCG16926.1 hypothetical protein DQ392_17720 [Streptomyces reniochalinae]
MTLTVSVVLVLGILVAVALKFRAVGVGAFILVALFGFSLSTTDAAPTINQLISALGDVVAGIGN